jgi:hypothetical protein
MPQADFSTEWVHRFTDPYALLGVSVAADDRRILKRYHAIAKQLEASVWSLLIHAINDFTRAAAAL